MFEEEIVIPECFYPEFMFLSILKKKDFLDSASSAEWQRGRCHSERLRESRIKRFWILNQVEDDKLLWIPSQAENDKEKRRMDSCESRNDRNRFCIENRMTEEKKKRYRNSWGPVQKNELSEFQTPNTILFEHLNNNLRISKNSHSYWIYFYSWGWRYWFNIKEEVILVLM